jgi:hypothetical protein
MPTPREGQTGTDPVTGRRVVVRQGRVVYADTPSASGGARSLSPNDAGYLREQREAAQKAAAAVRATDAFMALNKTNNTGQAWGIPGASFFSAPHQQMEGLTEGMLPGMRVPGSGVFTDADAKSARKAVPNLATLGDANVGRANFIRQNAKTYNDYVVFMERYAQQRGNLLGAEEAWLARGSNGARRPNNPAGNKTASPPPAGGGVVSYDANGNRIR